MPNIIVDLEVDRVDLVDDGANSAAFIKLFKRKEITMDFKELIAKMSTEEVALIQEAIDKAKEEASAATTEEVTKLKQEVATLQEALKKAKEEPEPPKDDIYKNLPEAIKEEMAKMKLQKDAAEEALRKAKEAELEAVAKATAAELKALPVAEEILIKVLKGSTPEMVDVLKAVSVAIEEVTLGEVGKGGGGQAAAKDAWGKIEKAAQEIATAESMTIQKAIGEVIKRQPALYKEYLEGGAN